MGVVSGKSLEQEEKDDIRNGKKPLGWFQQATSTVGPEAYNCVLYGPGWNSTYLLHIGIAREASTSIVEGLGKVAKSRNTAAKSTTQVL